MLAQYKSVLGQDVWHRARRAYGIDAEQCDSNISEVIERLKSLLPIGKGPGDTDDEMNTQSYAKFASKVQKENPDTAFTKDVMDRIFEHRASLYTVGGRYKKVWEKMLKRVRQRDCLQRRKRAHQLTARQCLGPESDRYWKNRS